ncbi:protein rolling stone [Biomphalaria glabrata]|nr:protein rolling stone-like [Biomphalaria glabrata]
MTKPVCFRSITKESFCLRHSSVQDFLLPWFNDNVLVYAVWTSICSLYCLSMILYSGLCSEHGIKILIWLTYWSFYCLFLRFAVTAANCWHSWVSQHGNIPKENEKQCSYSDDVESACMQCCLQQQEQTGNDLQPKRQDSNFPLIEKEFPKAVAVQWVLQNISNVSSLLVTVMFWALVYTGNSQTYVSINSHIMNSVLVLCDIMISRAPCRLQHLYIPLSFNVSYVLFTFIYWIAGGTNNQGQHYIYKMLDYTQAPGKAAVTITLVCLIALPLAYILVFGLFQLRDLVCRWYNKRGMNGHSDRNVVFSKDKTETGKS